VMPAKDRPDFIWMRPNRPDRAPAPVLSRDQIAAAAITVADEHGVDAVTMRNVAAVIGCGAMSLYRHVRTKDELLDVMIDTVAGEDGGPPSAPSGDWRTDLHDAARRLRADALRHPWLPQLWNTRLSFGPNTLARLEFALSAVAGLGLPIDQMARTVQTVHAFVHGVVRDELADRQWRASQTAAATAANPSQPDLAAYLQQVIASGRYPNFSRLAIEAHDSPDPDASFEWQLQRILDGLAEAIPRPRNAAKRRPGRIPRP
jgi:AcrR family transcriptional regulator